MIVELASRNDRVSHTESVQTDADGITGNVTILADHPAMVFRATIKLTVHHINWKVGSSGRETPILE